ncbi:hypothetical protein EmuJ_001141500 [Echinococcus multilocularis]|uniref:Uncharacterized protein n=1 Tax=Echinococcus multilocularis TaxID=6211 RepID=A0A068YFS4_ECHMU|nr:hypothetical protein EmuJ_001141500 [Echinococcus multilocularis]
MEGGMTSPSVNHPILLRRQLNNQPTSLVFTLLLPWPARHGRKKPLVLFIHSFFLTKRRGRG